MVPKQLRYTPTHEWCRMDGPIIVMGVTDHAVGPLGNVIYIELPEAGDDVLHEVPFGEIEGARDVKDLVSPFDGVIEAVNSAVVTVLPSFVTTGSVQPPAASEVVAPLVA